MRASAQGECQCNNPFHLIPTLRSTRAGAHATHKTAQLHRDVVEGPSLRPKILQQPTQYWHHRNHVLHEDADSRMVYDKQYRHSSPPVVTWPTRRSRLNPQAALHHDCGTPQQHTQIAHSQLAHSTPTTSSYAHYTTPRVEYTLVRYGFVARTIRCAIAVRLLPHRVYGRSSVQRLVDLKLPYDRLYVRFSCVLLDPG